MAVRLDSGSDSADRSWSTSGEGEAGDSAGEQTSTINIDEPAPKSYVCLGYIFSIIAGLCFTSWQEEPMNDLTFLKNSIFSNIGIKFAGLHIAVSSWQMLFVRCLGQSLGMLPLVWWSRSVTQTLLLTPNLVQVPNTRLARPRHQVEDNSAGRGGRHHASLHIRGC